jgi:hypothetical protein
MELQKVLSLIPANLLEELALETDVNIFSKKLQGEVMFKLLLHCIISHKDNSLRTMKSAKLFNIISIVKTAKIFAKKSQKKIAETFANSAFPCLRSLW